MSDKPMSQNERMALADMARMQGYNPTARCRYWWKRASVQKLVARGYAEVHPDETHLKVPPYTLTEAGKVAAKALKA